MRLSPEKLKKIIKTNKLKIGEVLQKAGVSKTAYYSLLKRSAILPGSLYEIADVLGVSPLAFMDDPHEERLRFERVLKKMATIIKKHPHVDPDNVRHTLLLLNEDPMMRLQRSLRRAQARNSQ